MMQVAPGIISSRMFARDDRPVPNIVAIYERPRPKLRRDATHVLGGMFGWNAPEEMTRTLRREDSPTEESTAPITSIPNSATADATLSGPSQRCVKRHSKRSKRRTIIPLSEMGASILSLSLQERMNRQQEGNEKEEQEPVSSEVQSSTTPADTAETTPDSTATVKKIKVTALGDVPTTKKLRLTISTAPPASAASVSTPLVQLPLSPPDTSSNASKAPADERYAGLIASSTPKTAQLPMPNFELDFSNLAGFSLSTLDSDSDSDSSSESSSESSSDSPDLSSSTSTRSASQDIRPGSQAKAKGKEKNVTEVASNKSRNSTPSVAAPSTGNPSTPPKRKRRTHPPGWVGWVQTEESPDHSRLIRLDDAPVILGRRTRSGKEFAEPPAVRRRSTAPNEIQGKRQTKPAVDSDGTGQHSKQPSTQQDMQKSDVIGETVESKVDGEDTHETTEPGHNGRTSSTGVRKPSGPVLADKDLAVLSGKTTSTSKRNTAYPGESASPSQLVQRLFSPGKNGSALKPPRSLAPSPSILKLTRSETTITPTGSRSKEVAAVKASPSKISGFEKAKGLGDLPIRPLPISDSPRKEGTQVSPEKTIHSNIKGTAQSHSKDTSVGLSRTTIGAPSSFTPTNDTRPTLAGSNTSPNPILKKPTISAIGSTSRGVTASGAVEKPLATPRNSAEKVQPAKPESTWSSAIQPTPSSGGLNRITSNVNSSASLKTSSSASKVAKPFPMTAPSRAEKSDLSPFLKLSALGKRKDSSSPLPSGQSSSSSQSRIKKRKLALSSSDESEGPKFTVNPFDRRAKKMELTRKGVSGEAFQAEMKKWMHAKKAEWKEKERQKEKQNERSGGSNEVRTAIAEGKPVSELVRHRLAGGLIASRIGEPKPVRKKVYNSDWGMDVAKVSVAGSSEKRAQPKPEVAIEKRDANVKDARESIISKIRRDSDISRETKPRRVAF